MNKTVNLSLSQVETLIQAGYQAALDDLHNLGVLETRQNRNPEVLKAMELSVTTLGKGTFNMYSQRGQITTALQAFEDHIRADEIKAIKLDYFLKKLESKDDSNPEFLDRLVDSEWQLWRKAWNVCESSS